MEKTVLGNLNDQNGVCLTEKHNWESEERDKRCGRGEPKFGGTEWRPGGWAEAIEKE